MSSGLAAQRNCIFISYRRDDARGASGRVWDWLVIGFGRERVFRDVASIGAGQWRHKIEQALAASLACVAVIGRRWADATNLPRLQDPDDMVRHELETALANGDRQALTVIPLLVDDAQQDHIPAAQLPESLRPLLNWNVFTLGESGWHDDTRRLIAAIAAATGLAVNPELEEWLALMAGAQQGLSMARPEQAAPLPSHQGEDKALASLLHQVATADPAERPALKAALAALSRGDTLLAEASFEREVHASQRLRLAAEQLATSEGCREAAAARHVASLAMVRGDLSKAVRYLQLALAAHPKDLDAAVQLGHAWISCGDLAEASRVFSMLIEQARGCNDPRLESSGLNGKGDVLVAQGDGAGALSAYQAGLAITAGLAQLDPANTKLQRDLSVSHDRIGDVLVAQGDGAGALSAYQAGLAIAAGLAQLDPANTEWQRDLSVSHDRIGDVLVAQGDGAAALSAYQAGLTIRAALAQLDPANTQWQRDLSVSHDRIGNVLVAQGDGAGALLAYQAGLAIAAGLAQLDAANTQWQRDLSVSHNKIGDVLVAQGDSAGALSAYQAGLAIRAGLVQLDAANTQWQRDLSVNHDRIGDVLVAQGDSAGALSAYQAGLAIAVGLAKLDAANTQWQRDLSVSHNKVGDVLVAQGNGVGALSSYKAGLAITAGLAQLDAANTQWQRDLSVIHDRIGDVLVAQGDGAGALLAYQAGLAIRAGLAQLDPANAQWQVDVAVSCAKLGTLDSLLPIEECKMYLDRGLKIITALKQSGRLHANQDWTGWIDHALNSLP